MLGWRGGWIVRWWCHEKRKVRHLILFQGSSHLHCLLTISLSCRSQWLCVWFSFESHPLDYFSLLLQIYWAPLSSTMSGFVLSPPLDCLWKERTGTCKKKRETGLKKPVLKNRSPIRTSRIQKKHGPVRSSGPRLALPGVRWEYLWDFQFVGWFMSAKGNLWT